MVIAREVKVPELFALEVSQLVGGTSVDHELKFRGRVQEDVLECLLLHRAK